MLLHQELSAKAKAKSKTAHSRIYNLTLRQNCAHTSSVYFRVTLNNAYYYNNYHINKTYRTKRL